MADYLSINEFPGNDAIMQVEVSFAGNNPDVGSGAVPYFKPSDVQAELFTPATATSAESSVPFTLVYVGPNTFITTAPVPLGKVLRMFRKTEDRYSLVNFTALQNVTEQDLDNLARQAVFLVEEAKDAALSAILTARQVTQFAADATSTANTALEQADTAVTAATAAVVTANNATTAAAGAINTANAAASDAAAALAAASAVETLAADAQASAAAANIAANTAVATANSAASTANAIDGKANTAIATANSAVATANAANVTANAIDGKATTAINTANAATVTANSAVTTANAIDGKATTALSTANSALTAANEAGTVAGQANTTASAANTTANAAAAAVAGKVNRTGDTMTGLLVAPAYRVAASTNPSIEFSYGAGVGRMLYEANSGDLVLATTNAFGAVTGIQASFDVNGDFRPFGRLVADRWIPRTGSACFVDAALGVSNLVEIAGGAPSVRLASPTGVQYAAFVADATNAYIHTGGLTRLNIGASGLGVTGAISATAAISAGGDVVAGAALLAASSVYAGGGAAAFYSDGGIAGPAWGGSLYNWVVSNFVQPFQVPALVAAANAAAPVGAVGAYAMLRRIDLAASNPGDVVSGGVLGYSSAAGLGSVALGFGNWRCMGISGSTGGVINTVTLWLRVS